ncbi:hypothetical protein DXG01_015174 [Tephrocybe rancida]|nr:hypothetical protein DXG01_015174 [Tephrocybe rancida]
MVSILTSTSQPSLKLCLTATTALHQALHHPNIVSLLSAFSTNQNHIHILELCSNGNLVQFLESRPKPTLTEPELRGVAKSLADGLAYLKKELVVHGDIDPSNILLTSDYGLAQTTSKVQSKAAQLNHRLPDDLSDGAKSLIGLALQMTPEERIYVPDILSHPFLANNLPVKSLRPIILEKPVSHLNLHQQPSETSRTVKNVSDPKAFGRNRPRLALADIGNMDLRTALSSEIASFKATRRVVSDPAKRTTILTSPKALDSYGETATPAFSLRANVTAPVLRVRGGFPRVELDSTASSFETVTEIADPEPSLRHKDLVAGTIVLEKGADDQELGVKSISATPSGLQLPIGTERPTPLNTSGMGYQTHKAVYGQITILPSHSLLADFRESQRRKGFRGDEVLLIDPDGQKLVLYLAGAKYTLMANAPEGEIEILIATSTGFPEAQTDGHSLRIRFSRKNKSIEIARHVSDSRGEEWKKRSIVSISQPPYISTADWKIMEQNEKDALHHLALFVKISEAVEEIMKTSPAPVASTIRHHAKEDKCNTEPDSDNCRPSSRAPTILNSFPSFSFIPRPAKLSAATSSLLTPELTFNSHTALSKGPHDSISKAEGVFSDTKRTWREDTNMIAGGRDIQTRFIPSVGWCIRYASSISQGGRYRLMFFDGVALEIDVDEDWVEFKGQSGEITG